MAINATDARDVLCTLELLIGKVVDVHTRSGEVGRFDSIIDDLKRMRGVRAAMILSIGGVLKAAGIPAGVQGERLAAMAATMQNMAVSASVSLNEGSLDRLVVEIDDSRLLAVNAGERNMLLVLAESRENLGVITAGMNEAVRNIREVLGESY